MPKKKIVFKTKWFNIEAKEYKKSPNYKGRPVYRLNTADGVIILASTEGGKIILIRQFRPAINREVWEFPAGALGNNEAPEDAARRELFEETGYECKTMTFVGRGVAVPNRINNAILVFYASGAVKKGGSEKGVKVRAATLNEVKKLIVAGELEEFGCMAVLLMVKLKLHPKELAAL